MAMAMAAKKLIEENVFYADGSPCQVAIAESSIGRVGEAAACAAQLAPDAVIRVRGRVASKDDGIEVAASEVSFPEVNGLADGPLVISLPATRCTPPVVDSLRAVLGAHPGPSEVQLKLVSPGRETVFRLDDGLRVTASQPLMADLKALLGPGCLV